MGPVILARQGPAGDHEAPAEDPETAAEDPGTPRGGQLVPDHGSVPACPCCYYNTSMQLDPADPGRRTCGWFWDDHRQNWVWWHGQAPHAPYPYPQQDLFGDMDRNQLLMSLRQGLAEIEDGHAGSSGDSSLEIVEGAGKGPEMP